MSSPASAGSARPEHHHPERRGGRGGGAGSLRSPSVARPLPSERDGRPAPATRRVLHLDVDAFLASVEQVVHPELRGRPVVVGGLPSERNLVMSCSYDVRARGVRPGMPLAEAARRCPEAVFRRGDSQAANRLREAIARVLMRWSPLVEVASLDDFFIDLSGAERLHGPALEAAERMRAAIRAEVGLPVTIGVATNRTMARLAGMLGKPCPSAGETAGGVAEILPGGERAFLRNLPVGHLPGVGHSTRRLLERFAIRTVGELALVSREVLFASFGPLGLVLYERARGVDPEPVEATYAPEGRDGTLRARAPRSIQRISTFEPEEGAREVVEAMLSYLVERAAHKLRAHGLQAASLEVTVAHVDTRPPSLRRVAGPRTGGGYESGRRRVRRALERPSDSTDALWRHARALLRELPRRRALTKRVGLTLLGLSPSPGWQGALFGDADRRRRLDRALDALRARLGFGRVLRGASLPVARICELGPDGFRLRTPSLNQ